MDEEDAARAGVHGGRVAVRRSAAEEALGLEHEAVGVRREVDVVGEHLVDALQAQAAAVAALEDQEHVAKVRELTHRSLRQLSEGLGRLGFDCVPSDANFVLVELGRDAEPIYQALLQQGVITRPLGGFGLTEHLRVTAGLPDENERLIEALAREVGK